MFCFKDTNQISELDTYEFKLPKYPESTTDPTYYEPTATRIANMRKSASSTKCLYDFEGDEAKAFADPSDKDHKKAFAKLSKAQVDPRFNQTLTREEVSQVVNNLGDKAEQLVTDKKAEKNKLKDVVNEAVTVQKFIESTKQNTNTSEE